MNHPRRPKRGQSGRKKTAAKVFKKFPAVFPDPTDRFWVSEGPVIIYREEEGGGGAGANKGLVAIFYAEV